MCLFYIFVLVLCVLSLFTFLLLRFVGTFLLLLRVEFLLAVKVKLLHGWVIPDLLRLDDLANGVDIPIKDSHTKICGEDSAVDVAI